MRSFLPFFMLFVAAKLFAQDTKLHFNIHDSVILSEVEVTAARYGQQLRNLAVPMHVVTQEQLQRNPTADLSSALASTPGIQLQSATFQTIKLTIRGIGSRSQYGTNRTKVYINEVPLTTGDGTSIFDDLETSFLSQAEVTKGSFSAWHGSGMGGVLRFVTRKADELKFEADAQVTAGSFGLFKYSGMAFSNFKNGKVAVGLSRLSGDGYRQNSAYDRNSGLMVGEFSKLNIPVKVNYLLMLSDVYAHTPSSVDETTFLTNPAAAAPNWLNVKGFKAYKRMLAGLKVDTRLSSRISNSFFATRTAYDQHELRPFNILDDRSTVWSIQNNVHYSSQKLTATVGVEFLWERYYWQTSTNNEQTVIADAQQSNSQRNAYLSAEYKPTDNLRWSIGANLNFSNYVLTDNRMAQTQGNVQEYAPKAIFSPMTSIIYHLSRAVSVYGSVGHGFSNPTVEESLSSAGAINSALRPEQGWTVDVGLRSWLAHARISIQASAYAIFLNDLLVIKRPTEDVFYGENAGSSLLRGLELSMNQQPFKWLHYTFSASVSDNRFRNFIENENEYAHNQLPGIPNSHAFAALVFDLPWNLKLNKALRYVGQQFADDANQIAVSDWLTVDAGLAFDASIFKKFDVQIQFLVNNLFDARYASMVLVNAPSFRGRMPRYYYPALPRNFAFSIRVK